jgi:hypothetical protein
MYQVISWDPADTTRPEVQRTMSIPALCQILFEAGKAQHEVVVDEYHVSEQYGESFTPIYTSTQP